MWFFYKETRRDRLLGYLKGLSLWLLDIVYALYYILIIILSVTFLFLLPLTISNTRISIFIAILLISVVCKIILDIYTQGWFRKRKLERKARRRNHVVTSKYFPKTDKKVAPVGFGKDVINLLITTIKAKAFRSSDVEDLKEYFIFLEEYFNMDILNNILMNKKIGKSFFTFTKKRISYLIYYYLGSSFKVHPKQVYYDYQMKEKNPFHKSQLVIADGMYGEHIFDYLIDYIILFVRLYYKNIYMYSNQGTYESVCHKTGTIIPAHRFGYNMVKMRDPNRIDIFCPNRNAIAETESGLNNHNLKRDLLTEMTKNGAIDFDPMKRQAFGELGYGKTDQVVARNVKVSEEHEQAKTYIQQINEIYLYPKKMKLIKMNMAIKEWFNFWVYPVFKIVKDKKKLKRLKHEKYLDCQVVMSEDGLKKAKKRFRFNKPEDLESGGYVKLMAYAIDIYSIYLTDYMGRMLRSAREKSYDDLSKSYSKKLMKYEKEQNYYSEKPYETLELTDEDIERMGYSFMNDLINAQKEKIKKERNGF